MPYFVEAAANTQKHHLLQIKVAAPASADPPTVLARYDTSGLLLDQNTATVRLSMNKALYGRKLVPMRCM
jgi:hypothetical protein